MPLHVDFWFSRRILLLYELYDPIVDIKNDRLYNTIVHKVGSEDLRVLRNEHGTK